jgi:hypothetical protein
MATEECPVPQKIKSKWITTDIFSEEFYKRIYHYNIKNFMAPSTAIGHRRKIVPTRVMVDDIINDAENILQSWGFNNSEINTIF